MKKENTTYKGSEKQENMFGILKIERRTSRTQPREGRRIRQGHRGRQESHLARPGRPWAD